MNVKYSDDGSLYPEFEFNNMYHVNKGQFMKIYETLCTKCQELEEKFDGYYIIRIHPKVKVSTTLCFLVYGSADDIRCLLPKIAQRGPPGCMGSLDCTHWEWENCPTTWEVQFTGYKKKQTIIGIGSYV